MKKTKTNCSQQHCLSCRHLWTKRADKQRRCPWSTTRSTGLPLQTRLQRISSPGSKHWTKVQNTRTLAHYHLHAIQHARTRTHTHTQEVSLKMTFIAYFTLTTSSLFKKY